MYQDLRDKEGLTTHKDLEGKEFSEALEIFKKYRQWLKRYAKDLFALDDALKSLAYGGMGRPAVHYDRKAPYNSYEMYWYTPPESPPANIILHWSRDWCMLLRNDIPVICKSAPESLGEPYPRPPEDIQIKAAQLLRELDKNRELLALYRTNGIEDDKFVLNRWIYLPEDLEYGLQKLYGCSSAQYTITRDGVLGLDRPWTDDQTMCNLLGV